MDHALGLSGEQLAVGLGAMKTVAMANGSFDALEREWLEAASAALGGRKEITEATPEQVAAAFPDRPWRQRILQALVGTALVDGEATRDELACIDRFARALEVDEPWVKNLHRLVDGHLMRLRFDFARRMPIARSLAREMWDEQGVQGLWKLFRTVQLKGTSEPELAWKYKRLGLLPEGTLGREFWAHMTERGFAFPGEPGGLLEKQVHHDLTHVLTGFGTDPEGECQVAAFYAGFVKEEAFGFLFMVLVMFHLGVKLAPTTAVTTARLTFDPTKVVRAIERGAKITFDPTNHWDFWPDVDKPLAEVRRRYGFT